MSLAHVEHVELPKESPPKHLTWSSEKGLKAVPDSIPACIAFLIEHYATYLNKRIITFGFLAPFNLYVAGST